MKIFIGMEESQEICKAFVANGKKYSPTHYYPEKFANKIDSTRSSMRSKTYSGIASAMATQWSAPLNEPATLFT